MNGGWKSLSKGMIAFLAIAGGILFIILNEPPHSVCDSQVEVFRKSQERFLFLNKKAKAIKTTRYEELRDLCKNSNNPGGCYEYFQEMRTLLADLANFTGECASTSGKIREVKRALWETSELMVRAAWGDSPPAMYSAKFAWLDVADMSFYCKLKARIELTYGADAWAQFREGLFAKLPGVKGLNRSQIWELSLFSENCSRYP